MTSTRFSRLLFALLLVGCGVALSFQWVVVPGQGGLGTFSYGKAGLAGWVQLSGVAVVVLMLLLAAGAREWGPRGAIVVREATFLLAVLIGFAVYWSVRFDHEGYWRVTAWPWIAWGFALAAAVVAASRASRDPDHPRALAARERRRGAWRASALFFGVPVLAVVPYFFSWPNIGFRGFAFDVALAVAIVGSLVNRGVATSTLGRRLAVESAWLLALVTACGLLNVLFVQHSRYTGNWPQTGLALAFAIAAPVLALVVVRRPLTAP